MVVGLHFPGNDANRAALTDALQMIVIRLASIAERCEDENVRYELREAIEQLVQVIAGLSGRAERNPSQ